MPMDPDILRHSPLEKKVSESGLHFLKALSFYRNWRLSQQIDIKPTHLIEFSSSTDKVAILWNPAASFVKRFLQSEMKIGVRRFELTTKNILQLIGR